MAIENNDPGRTVLGTALSRAGGEEIGWSLDDLSGHMWLLGKSGRGKTTTLYNLAVSLMEGAHGLGVIDPHGDLSRDLLDALPSSRVRDLVYFDPSSQHVVTFNPLANVAKERIAARAADLLATFKAVWGEVGCASNTAPHTPTMKRQAASIADAASPAGPSRSSRPPCRIPS